MKLRPVVASLRGFADRVNRELPGNVAALVQRWTGSAQRYGEV